MTVGLNKNKILEGFGADPLASHTSLVGSEQISACCKPPRYVPYKGTDVPYDGTYGTPGQGQTLDV